MSALTLPGDIPGLLRRGSPVIDSACSGVVVEMPTHNKPMMVWDGGSVNEASDDIALDCESPTGRAHVAWWLAPHLADGAGPLARELGVERWQDIDYTLLLACAGVHVQPEQIDLLRRVVLHVAGRTSP